MATTPISRQLAPLITRVEDRFGGSRRWTTLTIHRPRGHRHRPRRRPLTPRAPARSVTSSPPPACRSSRPWRRASGAERLLLRAAALSLLARAVEAAVLRRNAPRQGVSSGARSRALAERQVAQGADPSSSTQPAVPRLRPLDPATSASSRRRRARQAADDAGLDDDQDGARLVIKHRRDGRIIARARWSSQHSSAPRRFVLARPCRDAIEKRPTRDDLNQVDAGWQNRRCRPPRAVVGGRGSNRAGRREPESGCRGRRGCEAMRHR